MYDNISYFRYLFIFAYKTFILMNINLQQIKQRYGIIGESKELNHALTIAAQVAPTDLSVLIVGESGTGKDNISKIIHQYSSRKHSNYFAVNCGAIPEGTIDSELFGHEKGAFTGAVNSRKGYFEIADGGTLFLDEIGEMPKHTQSKLLRVLENGELIKVGASKATKSDVRIVAASNINFRKAIEDGKFREDLYYRLNAIPIYLPPLRERREDIKFLFRKFASDFADRYKMPAIKLSPEATRVVENYRWPGNIRQLKNITEQISSIEKERLITESVIKKYIPDDTGQFLPAAFEKNDSQNNEMLFKIIRELQSEVYQLRQIVHNKPNSNEQIVQPPHQVENHNLIEDNYNSEFEIIPSERTANRKFDFNDEIEIETVPKTLQEVELDLIKKTLKKHNYNKRETARELDISERTLYRKIKEFDL